MIVIGIDPGVNGAVACYDTEARSVTVYDMPTIGTGVKNRRTIDANALKRQLAVDLLEGPADLIVLEEVSSMPRDGAVGAFAFGRSFGKIEGVLQFTSTPVVYVRPSYWKKRLQVPSDKDAARRIAARLIPSSAHLWPLKKHDGRAEAALIAYYGAHYVANEGRHVA